MLTIFTTAKPFKSHAGVIQRNALKSWTLLRPACQILLIGNDEGSAEVAAELGITHLADVEKTDYGVPRIDSLFRLAEQHAESAWLCYLNADIILMQDFIDAVQHVAHQKSRFLAVGRRWNFDIDKLLSFSPGWDSNLRHQVEEHGELFSCDAMDYFVFPKGLYRKIPPMGVGREGWDNWMIYHARKSLAAVVDLTPSVFVVHQNHDYGKFKNVMERFTSPETLRNQQYVGVGFFDLRDATYELSGTKVRPVWRQHFRWHLWRACLLFPAFRYLLLPLSSVKRRLGYILGPRG